MDNQDIIKYKNNKDRHNSEIIKKNSGTPDNKYVKNKIDSSSQTQNKILELFNGKNNMKLLSIRKHIFTNNIIKKVIKSIKNDAKKETKNNLTLIKKNNTKKMNKEDLIFPYLDIEKKYKKWNIMNLGKQFLFNSQKNIKIKTRNLFYSKCKTVKDIKLKKIKINNKPINELVNRNDDLSNNQILEKSKSITKFRSRNIFQDMKNMSSIKKIKKRIPSYIRMPKVRKILYPKKDLTYFTNNYELHHKILNMKHLFYNEQFSLNSLNPYKSSRISI